MATLYTYPSAMTCHWFTTISSKSTTKLDTRLLKLLLQYLAVWKSESLSRMLPHGPELVVSTSLIKFCQMFENPISNLCSSPIYRATRGMHVCKSNPKSTY